jgi:hypothetical protein
VSGAVSDKAPFAIAVQDYDVGRCQIMALEFGVEVYRTPILPVAHARALIDAWVAGHNHGYTKQVRKS